MVTFKELVDSLETGSICHSDGMIEVGESNIFEFEVVKTVDHGVVFVDGEDLRLWEYEELKKFFESKGDDLDHQLTELGIDESEL